MADHENGAEAGRLTPAHGAAMMASFAMAGGKNLGATHITNGCFRLHPVEWNVGESAGEAATLPRSARAALGLA